MSEVDALIENLVSVARAHADLPPYEKATVQLSLGELTMIAKGLGLLAAVRRAQR